MAKFICKQPCWHNGHRYRLGDLVEGDATQMPHTKRGELRHFTKIENGEPIPSVRQPDHRVTVNEKG
jgi:hypothetical protein